MMTKEEARIFLLEEALIQSRHTIYFLHMCLTPGSGYCYSYPEQTLQRIEAIDALVKIPRGCVHSRTTKGCKGCIEGNERFMKRHEAKEALGNDKE